MTIPSSLLIQEIMHYEGFSAGPVLNRLGMPCIGYGFPLWEEGLSIVHGNTKIAKAVKNNLPNGYGGINESVRGILAEPLVITEELAKNLLEQRLLFNSQELAKLFSGYRHMQNKCAHAVLLYQAKEILLRCVDQKNQSDLVFLASLCRQNGFRLKVADNKIIIEESKEQEKRRIITQSDYCSFNVRVQSQDVYNGVHIKYYDALEEKDFEYQFTPQNAPKVGKVLELNDRVENFAEAEQVAKARLREKNKKAVELTMKIYPNPFIRCGAVLEFSPVAFLGETFIVSEMNYSLDGKTLLQNLKLNLCLEY